MSRACAWCKASLGDRQRRDALYCSVRCRQASWRFGVRGAVALDVATPKRLAYADPPYPGLAHYYPERREVDHSALLSRLQECDGWALSTSARALQQVLALCPLGVRVAAWLKKPRGSSAWEPLIVKPSRADLQTPDALVYGGRYRTFPGAMVGMKPPQFAVWLFGLLGARPGDEFHDLFPGSGAITLAWRRWSIGDASRQPAPDASSLAERDASLRTSRDASRQARGDASCRRETTAWGSIGVTHPDLQASGPEEGGP